MASWKEKQLGRPIQMIYFNEEGLTFNKHELLELLGRDDVKDLPVVVLSVAGICRTGKSFLLNFLMRYLKNDRRKGWIGPEDEDLSGFEWRQGVHTTTQGISIWSQPFHTLRNGRKVAILLMDTQGMYDTTSSSEEAAIIFGLSTLISSTQIYNVLGKFEDRHFNQLQIRSGIGKLQLPNETLKVHFERRTDELLFLETAHMVESLLTKSKRTEPFQRLVYLIRDWMDPASFPFGSDGGQKYLHYISQTEGQLVEFIKLQDYIKTTFEEIGCFLMPGPGQNATETTVQDESPDTDEEDEINAAAIEFRGQPKLLRKDFRKHLRRLAPFLLDPENLIIKKIDNTEASCLDLLNFIEKYVSILKTNRLPDFSLPHEERVKSFNMLYIDEILKKHEEEVERLKHSILSTETAIDPRNLESTLHAQEEKGKLWFRSIARGGSDEQAAGLTILEEAYQSSRNSLYKEFNLHILREILEVHHQRVIQSTEECMNTHHFPDTVQFEQTILREEGTTRENFRERSLGGRTEKSECVRLIEERMITLRKILDSRFNEVVKENIIGGYRERANKIIESVRKPGLPNYEKLEGDFLKKGRDMEKIFVENAKGGPNGNEDRLRQINEQRRVIEMEFRKQLIIYHDAQTVLERLAHEEDTYIEHVSKVKRFHLFMKEDFRTMTQILAEIRKYLKYIEDGGNLAVGVIAAGATAVTAIKVFNATPVVPTIMIGQVAKTGADHFREARYLAKLEEYRGKARSLAQRCLEGLQDITISRDRIVHNVEHNSGSLNKYKVLISVLATAVVQVPLTDFIPKGRLYVTGSTGLSKFIKVKNDFAYYASLIKMNCDRIIGAFTDSQQPDIELMEQWITMIEGATSTIFTMYKDLIKEKLAYVPVDFLI